MSTIQMPAHTRKFLEDIAEFPPLHTLTPEEIRRVVIANAISDHPALAGTEDALLDGPHGPLAVRIYRPLAADGDPLPVIVFFHGGGFVFNRIDQYDPMCRKLAAETGHAVVSVDYSLAPERKFPVPVDEAFYAVQWVDAHAASLGFDPARIAVAGESAGGTLAAVVAQRAAAEGAPAIAHQILLCPVTDWAGHYQSKTTYGAGFFLDTALLDYCAGHFFRSDADRSDPLASPIYGRVSGLPPALIVTAELDPLRDEGEAYGKLLRDNGVRVSHTRFPGMIHLFYALTDLFEEGHEVYRLIGEALGQPGGAEQ